MATTKIKVKRENRFLRAWKSARRMTPEDRNQMLVDAGLMKQEDADQAKIRHRKKISE